MKILHLLKVVAAAALAVTVFPIASSAITMTFDDVAELSDYPEATFSDNARIFRTGDRDSVLADPNEWWYSTPDVLCFGDEYCGSETGSILFNTPKDFFSVVLLSGPGADTITDGAGIEAFDASGNSLGIVLGDPNAAYSQLVLHTEGIARVDFFSPYPGHDTWDDLQASMPEPTGALLFSLGMIAVARRSRR